MANKRKRWKQWEISFFWALKSCRWWLSLNWRLILAETTITNSKRWVKSKNHFFQQRSTKTRVTMGLQRSCSNVENRTSRVIKLLKNWCFQLLVLEKTLQSTQTVRRSDQSTKEKVNWIYWKSWCWKLAQYFGPTIIKQPTHWEN